MNQQERRIYLIRKMQREMPQYADIPIPEEEMQQRRLLRSLFNLRPPYPASEDFLNVQDAYLSEVIRERGIVEAADLPSVKASPRISLWQGDITTLHCDAIVNAANSALLGCWQPCHSCIDNIIHSLSGVQLRIRCNEIMQEQGHEEPTGRAKITPAYNLPCRYVLHTVGPIIAGPLRRQDCEALADCYRSCLELAASNGVQSIAFCCISTGVFHFPQKKSRRDCYRDGPAFPGNGHFHPAGHLQCFHRQGPEYLPESAGRLKAETALAEGRFFSHSEGSYSKESHSLHRSNSGLKA